MAATSAAALEYNDATLRSTHTRIMPAAATAGRRVVVSLVIGSGARNVSAILTHTDATTRTIALLAAKASVAGHASYVWEFAADSKTAGASLAMAIVLSSDGVTASSERASINVLVLDGVGAPHAFASNATSTGGTTKTVPQVTPTVADTVAFLIACDTEGGTSPTTPTTAWAAPSGVSMLADDYPPTTSTPVPTHIVGGAFTTTIASGTASPAYVFTANNSAIGSAWTILYPVTPTTATEPVAQAKVVASSAYNDATLRLSYDRAMPAAAVAGTRVLTALTIASGSRLLAATLKHADATTRTVSELAPKAALTNGGHACYVVEFAADAKTAGATLTLTQTKADGTTTDGLRASIPLVVLQGVGAPTGVTAPHSSASTTKTTPSVTPDQPDMVELTVASDSKGGAAPITTTSAWTAPEGFTLVVADYMAGTTDSPASTSAIAHRFGTRLATDSPAGGRQWLSNVANVGATWTVLYPTLAGSNASGLLAVVAAGFVSLELVFADVRTTPGTPVLASPATNITGTGFTSSWTAASSASDYLVQRRTGTNPFATVATVTTTTFGHAGLALSTAYDVRVIARNGTVEGTASNIVSTTTAAA